MPSASHSTKLASHSHPSSTHSSSTARTRSLLSPLCAATLPKLMILTLNLLSTLETNSKAVHAGLRIQIDELLAKAWQASITRGKKSQDSVAPTPIIVVDALDKNDRGTEFLEELLRFIQAGQLTGIKFLVTSRPEPKIVDICKISSSECGLQTARGR